MGVEELDVGAELPELPVLPEMPELSVLPLEVEAPVLAPVPAVDPAPVAPLRTLLAPGWSWARTIPMATVAPVARRAAPRVSCRTRAWPRSRVGGVLCWLGGDMRRRTSSLGSDP